tara:strand:- start:1288 stop:1512 length:225 start_codon:yes stop_codon:yes gene_type:complete
MLKGFLRILTVICLYILTIAIIYLIKPSIFFDNNKLKDIGFIHDNKSIISLYYISPIIVIFLYIIVLAIWKKLF